MASERGSVPAVLITGWPASGKSTVGRALAGRLGAALIDQDTVTEPLVAVVSELVGVSDLDDPRLAGLTRSARYETVIAVAEDNLRVGTPVVVVAPFTEERRDPAAWASLDGGLRAAGGAPLLVWLRLQPGTAAERLRARGAPRDLAKLADLDGFLRTLDGREPAGPHLSADAESGLERVVRAVLDALAPAHS